MGLVKGKTKGSLKTRFRLPQTFERSSLPNNKPNKQRLEIIV